MADLRFDGKVAVVTGAGAGLGRAYALLFASRGAKVVVNDLGGSRHGDGSSSKAADTVVDEIKSRGGIAVADYNSVVEGEKVVKTALDNFGRIDILINNAGILRDKSFARISDQDWDLIHAVHLKGSFKCTQAAFPVMKKQGFGRIIMTSSNSGLYGNFGQANYSAAKMGLVGLMNTVAIEGAKNNVYCNAIVPTAASRLTEDILPPDYYNELKPELIAPVVAFLCHDACRENGSIIESAAGWAGKCTIVRANGALLRSSIQDGVTVENVRDNWERITDIQGAQRYNSIQEVTGALMGDLDELMRGPRQTGNNSGQEAGKQAVSTFEFTDRDTILYALGVGASLQNPKELKYLYENHEEFSTLPTFFVQPAITLTMSGEVPIEVPGKIVDLTNVLHGEQYIEIVGQLPADGKLVSKANVVEVLDKGSGALLVINVESFNEKGELVVKNQVVTFAVGAGNFGGPRTATKVVPVVAKPSRSADISLSYQTTLDQAAIYRLSGDRNPLHIDPNMSAIAGFDKPILHGLCSFGISVRLILQAFADYDVSLFKASKARFVKPVTPGQTLKVDMWKEGNRIHFETSIVETNTVVISGAYVDLTSVKVSAPVSNSTSNMSALRSDAIFELIAEQLKLDPGKGKAVGGVFLYNITKDGKQAKQWRNKYVPIFLSFDKVVNSCFKNTLADDNWNKAILDFKDNWDELKIPYTPKIHALIHDMPEFIKENKMALISFSEQASEQVHHAFAMDLKNAKVYAGAPEGKPSTTLTISDDDFLLLAEGKLQPQQAFMKGKLKITGNLMLAQKLAPILKANQSKL